MAKISDVLFQLESVAPRRYAFEFDRVGLQVGDEYAPVAKATVSLDRSLGAIRFASENGCQLLLSHHPLIFSPLDEVTNRSHTSRSVLELVRKDIAFIAAHTNWDSALGGINDVLAGLLGVEYVRAFGSASLTGEQPAGRIGELPEKISFRELLSSIDERLSTVCYGWGNPEKLLKKVTIVGGAADGEWIHAQSAGAEVLVTGEVKQHIAVEASESGLCVVAAGHYATEHPGALALGSKMASLLPEIEWISYEPEPGFHGRPVFGRLGFVR